MGTVMLNEVKINTNINVQFQPTRKATNVLYNPKGGYADPKP